MTKRNICGFLCVLCSLFLLSCSSSKTKEDILNSAQEYKTETYADSAYDYQNEIGQWLTPETEYHYDEDADTNAGIIDLHGGSFIPQNDRLYCQISKEVVSSNGYSTGALLWAYISTSTGEKHNICPDPLCTHLEESDCKYLDFEDLIFLPNSDYIAYTIRHEIIGDNWTPVIYEINLNENTISRKYIPSDVPDEVSGVTLFLFFISENKLYFSEWYQINEKNEDGEIDIRYEIRLMALDLTKNTAEVLNNDFNQSNCVYASEDKLFFVDQGCFYCTDTDFSNERDILTFDKAYQAYDIFYDTNTNEFYLLISLTNMHSQVTVDIDTENVHCNIYKIDSNFECSKVPMPSELITDIQLTNEYIYYTVFDPVQYGVTRHGSPTVDETGNKLYRVKRSDTSSEELVFDGRNEVLFIDDYFVSGDYLYITYWKPKTRDGTTYFYRIGSKARINMKENTIKWINLD
ncbi:MAG: hypothetical protein ACI4XJ_03140 [Eubacteriales bacterium]